MINRQPTTAFAVPWLRSSIRAEMIDHRGPSDRVLVLNPEYCVKTGEGIINNVYVLENNITGPRRVTVEVRGPEGDMSGYAAISVNPKEMMEARKLLVRWGAAKGRIYYPTITDLVWLLTGVKK